MTTGYLGNQNLKVANTKIEFTEDEIKEFVRCENDIIYFVKNYMKIEHVDKGLIPFDLWDFQEDLIHTCEVNRFIICKFPRQTGKSTTIIAFFLHYILFNKNKSVAILANKAPVARELLSRLRLAYEHLPLWLQQGVVEWNKGSIVLENGSKIIASATSSSAIRGLSFSMILLDELAHVPYNIQEDFFSSVYPTISSGKETKVIVVSTPLGMEAFYKMWTDAVNGLNKFIPVEVHWSQHPEHDEEWMKETLQNMGEHKFNQEFGCDFLGSLNTLISTAKLQKLAFHKPIAESEGLKIYEMPIPDHTYVVTVDVAYGKGEDYSVLSVFDISTLTYKQVCIFRSNIISPLIFPERVRDIAKKYNEAYVLVEINDIGNQVAMCLHYDFGYDNLLQSRVMGRSGQQISGGFGKNSQLGVKTTHSLKRTGCSLLKTFIENDKLWIVDFDTISELSSFVAKGKSYEAEEGKHDDMVSTLFIFSWLVNQTYFKELTNRDIRIEMSKESAMNDSVVDELVPFGFISDGIIDGGPDPVDIDANGDRWFVVDDNL